MSSKNIVLISAIVILSLFYLSLLIGLSIDDYHVYFIPLIPILYMVTGLMLLYFHKGWSPNFLFFLLIILVAGFLIQLAAVKTGLIYGPYKYGTTLGPQISGVPAISIFNKFILLYCVGLFVKKMEIKQVVLASLLGAVIMLFINILAEPVATSLKFREWTSHLFVFHNYAARFIIAFAFLYLFNSMKFPKKNDIYLYVLLLEMLFLIVLNFTIS